MKCVAGFVLLSAFLLTSGISTCEERANQDIATALRYLKEEVAGMNDNMKKQDERMTSMESSVNLLTHTTSTLKNGLTSLVATVGKIHENIESLNIKVDQNSQCKYTRILRIIGFRDLD